MSADQIKEMFGDVPQDLFREHDCRNDIVTLGEVPAEFVSEVSGGTVDYSWPAQVNKLLIDGGHDLILSIGQVVPHEVAGMANYNKNIFVGTGGSERGGKIVSQTPMGRYGKPEDLLGTLLWLVSDEASGFVTGTVIPIDGGFSAYSGV